MLAGRENAKTPNTAKKQVNTLLRGLRGTTSPYLNSKYLQINKEYYQTNPIVANVW